MHRIDTVDGTAIYRDERQGTYHARVRFDRRDPALMTLLSIVSRATSSERLSLSRLGETVDPDALERLLAHWNWAPDDGAATTLSFRYEECDVTIRASGHIAVAPPDIA